MARKGPGGVRLIAYRDLPEPVPVTGPLKATVARVWDDYDGWAFELAAILLTEPPIPLRGFWQFRVKEGATRRFAERFAMGIEAGVVVGDMDLRLDVYGEPYVHFEDQPWTSWGGRTLFQWIRHIETELGVRGVPTWGGRGPLNRPETMLEREAGPWLAWEAICPEPRVLTPEAFASLVQRLSAPKAPSEIDPTEA